MAIFRKIDVADECCKGGVHEDWEGDLDVYGAFDETDDQWPTSGFLASAVVRWEGW